MMPDPEKQRAQNESKLLAEGITVPFYQIDANGDYILDDKELPILDPNATSIPFELLAAGGGTFAFDPATFSGHLLVFIVPTTSGPNSLQQLGKLSGFSEELGTAGIEIIAVSCDSTQAVAAVHQERKLKYPLLTDTDLQFITAYGCGSEDMEFPQRTMIGLGPDGSVLFFSRGFAYPSVNLIKKAFGLSD